MDSPESIEGRIKVKSFLDRLCRLDNEKKGVNGQISDVLNEVECQGFDKKTMKELVKVSQKGKAKFQEEVDLINIYMSSAGL